jgi:hypothetical protein
MYRTDSRAKDNRSREGRPRVPPFVQRSNVVRPAAAPSQSHNHATALLYEKHLFAS